MVTFVSLSDLSFNFAAATEPHAFTPGRVTEGRVTFVGAAANTIPTYVAGSEVVRAEVNSLPTLTPAATSTMVTGATGATVRTRAGDDWLSFRVTAADPITGVAIAVRNSHISGNRGNDVIVMEATAGKTRMWGSQAVVFGGAGDDKVYAMGAGVNSFIQMGLGNDQLSIGEHKTTNIDLKWTRPSGVQTSYGTISGGSGVDLIHFQHLNGAQFNAQYQPLAGGGFTLGADPTKYLEWEAVALNDGSTVSLV